MFYCGSRSIDPSYVAKIEIPNQDYEVVKKQIEQIPDQKVSITGSLTKEVNWWMPTSARVAVQRQYSPNGNYANVLLCQENGRWILYVEWVKI